MKMFSQSPESVITPYSVLYDVGNYSSGYVDTLNLSRPAVSCILTFGFTDSYFNRSEPYQFIVMKEIKRGNYLDDSIIATDGRTLAIRIALSMDGSIITINNTDSSSFNYTRAHMYFSIY